MIVTFNLNQNKYKFKDILKLESKKLISSNRYLEFWDSCIVATLDKIKKDQFDKSTSEDFIFFVIAGLNKKQLFTIFKQEYIQQLLFSIRKVIIDYQILTENKLLLYVVYEKELKLLEFSHQKTNFLLSYNQQLLNDTHLQKEVKNYLYNVNNIFLYNNPKKYIKKAVFYLNQIKVKNCSHTVLLIIEKTQYLIGELYNKKMYITIAEISQIIDSMYFKKD